MTTVIPGWYTDPQNQQFVRFWDGAQWTDQVRPAFVPSPATNYQPGYQQPQVPVAQSSGQQLWQQNRLSAITAAICVVYVVLALEAHFAVLGILPVLMTVRAYNRKEPLWALAAICTAAAVIISLVTLAH